MSANTAADSEDLEALFDSIIQDNLARETSVASETEPAERAEYAAGDVMGRIGSLTRTLHNALRELGYDRLLEKLSLIHI